MFTNQNTIKKLKESNKKHEKIINIPTNISK